MPFEFTQIRCPAPTFYHTSLLPKPLFDDSRASETSVLVNNKVTGGKVVYPQSSQRETLTLRFELTRQKALEVQEVIKAFQAFEWEIKLYNDQVWQGNLVESQFPQQTISKLGDNQKTGGELVDTTLVFSAVRVA